MQMQVPQKCSMTDIRVCSFLSRAFGNVDKSNRNFWREFHKGNTSGLRRGYDAET